MSQRITIDPITRIEGHLRIDCEIEGGVVTKAWSSGTMWRGMEEIVKGNLNVQAGFSLEKNCWEIMDCGKTNCPAYVRYVAEEVARLRDVPFETIAEATTENFFRLFPQARKMVIQ